MLSCDDAALVARETALPGLATLLDESLLLAELRQHLSNDAHRLLTLRANYLRYKPATSCLAGYLLTTAQGSVEMYSVAFCRGENAKLDKTPKFPVIHPVVGAAYLNLPDHCIQVRFAPNDREISALHRLSEDDSRRRLLTKILPEHPTLWDARPERLAYRPERRFVARVANGESGAAVIKLYSDTAYRTAANAARAISTASTRAPKLLGASERRRVFAIEWLAGRPLASLLSTSGPEDRARLIAAAGEVLADLHNAPLCLELPRLTCDEIQRRLSAATNSVIAIAPELEARRRGLFERLSNEPPSTTELVTLHGDYHPAQVVIGNAGQPSIVDFDEAATGPAGADVGNFLAHIECSAIQGQFSHAAASQLGSAFLSGYTKARPIPCRLGQWVAAALLRLAVEPFRKREPQWRERLETILRRAVELLEDRPVGTDVPWQCRSGSTTPIASADDRLAPLMQRALDVDEVQRLLASARDEQRCERFQGAVLSARLIRYKPARRCLIEYVIASPTDREMQPTMVVGKIRAKGIDYANLELLRQLCDANFNEKSDDSICIPEILGTIPELNMWLQRKVEGSSLASMIDTPHAVGAFRKVADSAVKLHRSCITPQRRHTMDDELRILETRFASLSAARPDLADRLTRLLDRCRDLAQTIPRPPQLGPIHRDFYHDQILMSGRRMYILDLDLLCLGDPALDIGNFLGHITELALRTRADADYYVSLESAVRQRFVELTSAVTAAAVEAYKLLTLARHVAISAEIPQRRTWTSALLELCEVRVGTTKST